MDLIRHTRPLTVAFGVVVAATALGAYGDDDDTGSGGAESAPGNGIDLAFVIAMIPHHELAVQMAEIAQNSGKGEFIKNLAEDIISSQNAEIATMRAIEKTLADAGVKPADLGISDHEMGMHMDLGKLRKADPFDREFIDMMIPHHQGAIRMARVELAKGSGAQTKELAEQIIAAQAREIEAMNAHRTEEFGAPSPAGGVPSDHHAQQDGEGDGTSMDHG